MSFIYEYVTHSWGAAAKNYNRADLKAWTDFLETAEKDRQRDRVISWRDRVAADDFAVNAAEPEYYRRTAGFVWRIKDASGKHRARDHQYLYNLEVYGHKQYTRRDKGAIAAAQSAVNSRVNTGELGPLSPLE